MSFSIKKLFDINYPFFWILCAITVRLLLFWQQSHITLNISEGLWGHDACDTPSYLAPVEYLIEKGCYFPDFRMPGYAIVYYLLRLFLSQIWASNILFLLQVVVSGMAVYYLGKLAYIISGSKNVFLAVYTISLMSVYSAIYDSYLLTESFCTSSGIFAFYFLIKAIEKNMWQWYFVSGMFFTWMVFLKPVYLGLFIILCVLLISLYFFRYQLQSVLKLKNILLFILPILIAESIWVTRNYVIHKQANLLTNPFLYPQGQKKYPKYLTLFIQEWGGVHSVWLPDGHNLWFEGDTTSTMNVSFPSIFLEGKINMDSLSFVKTRIMAANNMSLSWEQRKEADTEACLTLIRYREVVKKEHFLYCRLWVPVKYLTLFFSDTGSYLLFKKPFSELPLWAKAIRLFLSVLQFIILIGGTISGFLLLFFINKKRIWFLIPSLFAIYNFFIFPVIMRLPETRFMVPAYPFLIVCWVVLVGKILFLIKKR